MKISQGRGRKVEIGGMRRAGHSSLCHHKSTLTLIFPVINRVHHNKSAVGIAHAAEQQRERERIPGASALRGAINCGRADVILRRCIRRPSPCASVLLTLRPRATNTRDAGRTTRIIKQGAVARWVNCGWPGYRTTQHLLVATSSETFLAPRAHQH